jgi:hypothetical protein
VDKKGNFIDEAFEIYQQIMNDKLTAYDDSKAELRENAELYGLAEEIIGNYNFATFKSYLRGKN